MGWGRIGIGGATLGAACGLVAAAAAAPSAYPDYPPDRSRESMVAWLARQTDIDPASVIGVSDDALYAVEAAPGPGAAAPHRRIAVRQEALSAEFARTIGGRSLVMVVDVDCATKRAFQRELRLYRANNKLGHVQALGGGRDWETPPRNSAMEGAIAATCSGVLPLPASIAAAKAAKPPTPAQSFMRAATPPAPRPNAPPPPEIPPLPADAPIATGPAAAPQAAPRVLGAFE